MWLLARLWPVPLVPATAAVLAGTLYPLLDRLEARRLPRPVALGTDLLAVLGLGLGVFTPPNNNAVVGSAPPHRRGVAGGVLKRFPPPPAGRLSPGRWP